MEIDGRFAMWKTVAYYCASCCCITVVCVTADWLVFRFDAFQKYPILRAVTDNLTHGLVGCWCWATSAIFLGWGKYTAHECLLCFAVACAVDADHFIEARSLSFKAATSLPRRPFAHASTLIPVGALLLHLLLNCTKLTNSAPALSALPAVFAVGVFSHHIRDAERRGVWLWPFGSTPPLPYVLYVATTCSLPVLVAYGNQVMFLAHQILTHLRTGRAEESPSIVVTI